MGAPGAGMEAAEQAAAETLLTAFKAIDTAERSRHASVLNYWLSIRGDKEFPPLHDLDPLEISDAGPSSILFELISGGHDAEIRHFGEALKAQGEVKVERIIDAPSPSVLASIAKKLPIVAISRDFLAFEDKYSVGDAATRCWVTLLPLSAGGAWVDYVYALVSLETEAAKAGKPAKTPTKQVEPEEVSAEAVEEPQESAAELVEEPEDTVVDPIEEPLEPTIVAEEPDAAVEDVEEAARAEEPEVLVEAAIAVEEPEALADEGEQPVEAVADPAESEPGEGVAAAVAKAAPGFAKLFDSLAGLTGFYGSPAIKAEAIVAGSPPVEGPAAAEAAAEEHPPVEEPVAKESQPGEAAAEEQPVAEHAPEEPPAEEQTKQPTPTPEGSLQSKLTDVRAKADEARMAKIRANAALYEGLSAAYDFALDAEDAPEEYLRLVEAQGLKIQLRSPMKPVVKLAFDGLCDDSTIKQLEAVLAWALEQELPRGSLTERIEQAGGVASILNGEARPS